ncbi:MAG: hypothetical protein BAJATHORv1_20006 [Candidatus Thorarchaeota archaeon]|nr:MAG: hypothetical protein BAJATHORv1_20006 [Candidatus Thorarchaeota archaeon]
MFLNCSQRTSITIFDNVHFTKMVNKHESHAKKHGFCSIITAKFGVCELSTCSCTRLF